MDFSVFDSLLDATFVVDETGKIVYCNDVGATFCQTSVRRMVGKALLADFIGFAEPGLLPFTADSLGRTTPTALIETGYVIHKSGKSGKVQLTVRPCDDKHWVFFSHDVSLEETLAAKYRSELQQKEAYARNLEKLVEARTTELRSVNLTLKAILDSLGQGFFTFNAQGDCGSVFTKACEDILEGSPAGRKAWEVLAVNSDTVVQFQQWMETSFKELLPFEDLRALGPNIFKHSAGRHVVLDYFPIRNEQNAITDIVVVATDKTVEHRAQQDLEAERQYAAMIVKYLKNKEQFSQFIASVEVAFGNLNKLAAQPLDRAAIQESFRILHTLEGEAGAFSLHELRHSARESQQWLEPFKEKSLPAENQRDYVASLVSMKKTFVKFLSENENIFRVKSGELARSVELPFVAVQEFLGELEHKTQDRSLLRKYSELFLQVPFESRLKYFDGVIQSVSERLGKKVKPLEIHGGDLRIFPDPYQGFFSSLVHAFRNAVDHGLEMPEERERAGKDPAGRICVEIEPVAGGFSMTICDDGKGIDPAIIRAKLIQKFPQRDFSHETDEQIVQHVSLPGFSSREEVGEFSGRGVGLDALREEVLSIGGTLHLKSKVGSGTTIELFIPELGCEPQLIRSA